MSADSVQHSDAVRKLVAEARKAVDRYKQFGATPTTSLERAVLAVEAEMAPKKRWTACGWRVHRDGRPMFECETLEQCAAYVAALNAAEEERC